MDLTGFIVFAALQVADVLTTLRFLSAGVREGNSIIAKLMAKFGNGWIAVKLLGAAVAAGLIFASGLVWPIWVLNVIYAAAVVWNWRAVK